MSYSIIIHYRLLCIQNRAGNSAALFPLCRRNEADGNWRQTRAETEATELTVCTGDGGGRCAPTSSQLQRGTEAPREKTEESSVCQTAQS